MKWRIQPQPLTGSVNVPGDKSIAHRALLIAALASGESEICGLPSGEDVASTCRCLRQLGISITQADGRARIVPRSGLVTSPNPLDAGNSGTTMRLLTGVLASISGESAITSDDSLARRPMGRVIEPLTRMGASIWSHEGRAPLRITGGSLRGIRYTPPVASAQVKSAVLLAGLAANGETTVVEPIPTRDHTERLLAALGVPLQREGSVMTLAGGAELEPFRLTVPGDLSSAAFFLAAGALHGQVVVARSVGVNPTRVGFLRVLERMGVMLEFSDERIEHGEPVADITVRGRVRNPAQVESEEVPSVVDELPLVALLATAIPGVSRLHGAAELRVKETDRIATTVSVLRAFGADIEEQPDGWVVCGHTPLHGAMVSSGGDHRLAMMAAVAGSVADGETTISRAEAGAISYPDFAVAFRSLGGRLRDECGPVVSRISA